MKWTVGCSVLSLLLLMSWSSPTAAGINQISGLTISYWTNTISVLPADTGSLNLVYRTIKFTDSFGDRQEWLLTVRGLATNDILYNQAWLVSTQTPSTSLYPSQIGENLENGLKWDSNIALFGLIAGSDDSNLFAGPIANGNDGIFGFKLHKFDGVHFGWARARGTNGHDLYANVAYNFDTNRPPILTEIEVNQVPWAPILVGQRSPGGPALKFKVVGGSILRLNYPDWADRYAVRQRSAPRGAIVKTFKSGREGLELIDGLFTIDISLDQAAGFFELYLPDSNR